MGYFDDNKNVDDYIRMADGYDGCQVVKVLERYLPPGSSVLEVGIGPGKDLTLLGVKFKVCGSDLSQLFVDMYLNQNKDVEVFQLDAVEMNIQRKFDCIYSNKVLHCIDQNSFRKSLVNQSKVLNKGGLLCHTLWYGDKMVLAKGERYYYYSEKTILNYIPSGMNIIHSETYQEMDENDSLLIILKKY
ncbi:MAG: class I SAM-dependent methyltransferase [Bacteroidales bacterium]|nr:class I SAM-dependent methyltransferase [Bacteroidales bacterium]MCF8403373.1 class I SAM-dependent methyltransferase [Bacteroidales bacterium]